MKIKNWIACVQDRGKWKEVIEKAKTFIQEVQRLEEEEEEPSTQQVSSDGVTAALYYGGVWFAS